MHTIYDDLQFNVFHFFGTVVLLFKALTNSNYNNKEPKNFRENFIARKVINSPTTTATTTTTKKRRRQRQKKHSRRHTNTLHINIMFYYI